MGCLWPILQRQAESPEVFKTHNQIKQVIHSQNKQYAMLLGVLDLERDTGTIEVERNKQKWWKCKIQAIWEQGVINTINTFLIYVNALLFPLHCKTFGKVAYLLCFYFLISHFSTHCSLTSL